MILYAILSAGDSTRMGFAKAVTPLAGVSPLARIAATLDARPIAVVTRDSLREACEAAAPQATVLVNEDPARGMTSSLRVVDRIADRALHLAVWPADKPFIMEATLLACERAAADGIDVVYPVSQSGVPGHPVIFSPRARALLANLRQGDTLRSLRDDPSLTRAAVACDDEGAFLDLDTPEQWRDAEVRYGA